MMLSRVAKKGDTGGPFIIDENGKWFQVGLFSYGKLKILHQA